MMYWINDVMLYGPCVILISSMLNYPCVSSNRGLIYVYKLDYLLKPVPIGVKGKSLVNTIY